MAPKKQVKVAGDAGTIKGRVLDATSGSPLIGVGVAVVGTDYKTKTDINGEYELSVPPGTYQVRISYDAYEGMTISGVAVAKDQAQAINRELKPIAGMTQTVVVKAEINKESSAGKLVERKKAASARDVMSRDDIRKSGGGSASSVARRIVGTTVVGDRFIFVRGLGHRYGNTLLDGARLPSPDPNLRTVPLDIIPSGALSAINVQKTATPDVPADFAGASVQLETRETPDKLLFQIDARVGANTATTFQQANTGDRFAGDNLTFGNLGRDLPNSFDTQRPIRPSELADVQTGQPLYSPAQLEKFGESLPSLHTAIGRKTAMPNFGAGLQVGNTWKPWGTRLGFLTALQYNNVHQTLREQHRIYSVVGNDEDGYTLEPQPAVRYEGVKTTQNVQASALLLVKWNFNKNHRLELTGVYSRDADNEARTLKGQARNTCSLEIAECLNTRLRYIMRSVAFTRLGGRHEFPGAGGLTLDWFGSFAQARQDDPLLRESLFADNGVGYRVVTNESGKFQFFKLVDNTGTGALNLTLPFKQWRGIDSRFKVGGWAETRRRGFDVRTLDLEVRNYGGLPPGGTGNIFNKDTVGGDIPMKDGGTEPFVINEIVRPDGQDGYKGTQSVYAGYAMLDLPFTRWFRLVGGARFEAHNLTVAPYSPYAPNADPAYRAALRDRLVLPSGSLIFSPRSDMNIRLAGAETVARPEMRELSKFLFVDFAGGFGVQGNPDLKSTKVWNADLRWEWFPSANEVLAASVFYKYFDSPIERVIATSPRLQTFRNALMAQNVGVELEARKNLSFIHPQARDFSLGVNFAYIYSRVQIPPPTPGDPLNALTSQTRPLEGQSPYVVNAYFAYDSEKSGTNVRLLYNTFGRRIVFVGANHLPDVYEKPIHTLDFAMSQRVYKGLNLNFIVNNMLNWRQTYVLGPEDTLFYQTRKGTSFILGLSYSM
nr:TonB-dependent receptor [Nannocystis sp. SCPEA4]